MLTMKINKSTVKTEINFRNLSTKEITLTIPKDSCIEWRFIPDNDARIEIKFEDKVKTLSLISASKKLTGFTAEPTLNTMSRWIDDGIARSVTGKRVEPDGHGDDGSPSWLLVLGFI